VVTFTVAVTPGSTSTNIGVLADVSTITARLGRPRSMTRRGGGHGDASAADGVFTLAYTIPAMQCKGVAPSPSRRATHRRHRDVFTEPCHRTCTDSGAPVVISKTLRRRRTLRLCPQHGLRRDLQSLGRPVDLTGWNVQYQDASNDFSPQVTVAQRHDRPRRAAHHRPAADAGIGLPIPTPDFSADLPGFGFDNHFGGSRWSSPLRRRPSPRRLSRPAQAPALLTPAGW